MTFEVCLDKVVEATSVALNIIDTAGRDIVVCARIVLGDHRLDKGSLTGTPLHV